MFNQFGYTAETLSKASTMVFRIGSDAHLYDDPEDVNISPLLDSKFDSEKCEALKRLLALIAQGFDVSNFFPQVVKNVASQSLEVKKLVYLYLLHYAERRPNEALLSINCFQKDLGDINPLVRAWALRTMAGIRLHVIAPLVLVAVKKCARDSSVYVRKCAANALPKIHDLRLEETVSTVEEIVEILLSDSSPGVVGAAAAAFASVCPNNLFLIGRHYQKLCEVLPDVEEWGQIILIGILLRYEIARHGLVKESIMCSLPTADDSHKEEYCSVNHFSSAYGGSDVNGFHMNVSTNMISRSYIEGPDEYLSRSSFMSEIYSELSDEHFVSGKNHNDVKILLQCTSPLLWSNNSAVVLAATSVHWIMAPREDIKKIVKPLLFLLRSSNSAQYVVLCNIQVFAKAMPSLFAPYFEDFFVCCSDSCQVKHLKLEILSIIATDLSISSIFKEFQDYIRDPDRKFAADTVAAIGVCAKQCPKMANLCLDRLLSLTRQDTLSSGIGFVDGEADVLVQAIKSIKLIIQEDLPRHEKVIIQLIRGLDVIKVPAARALIIWMVGEYNSLGDIITRMLPVVIKYLARSFTSEALEAKLQILNTTVKVLLWGKGEDLITFKKACGYLIELAKCDLNYDLRDRARLMKKLLSCYLGVDVVKEDINVTSKTKDLSTELAEFILVRSVKPILSGPANFRFYLPGSLSQIVLHAAPGYESLPKPCSLRQVFDTLDEPSGADNSESLSGSLDEESASDYSSRQSVGGSSESSDRGEASDQSESEESDHPLIQLSHAGNAHGLQNGDSQPESADVKEIMSKSALESWLNEQPVLSSLCISEKSKLCTARISIGDISGQINPKSYLLLDPANSNGLKVEYTFSSEISNISPLLVCLEFSFTNCSTETKREINVVPDDLNEASDSKDQAMVGAESSFTSINDVPTVVPMEEVTSLDPSQMLNRILQVRFHHHLLPLKLSVYCDGKRHPVKLRPDIGYFVKPLPMDIESFTNKVSHLPGICEFIRRATFTDHIEKLKKNGVDDPQAEDKFLVICQSLAVKMLSSANVFLVSVNLPVSTSLDDASGLCLLLSAEILSNSIPCMITLTVEGKCLDPLVVFVKVNCEETVFGLNLLNRIVNFLAEQPFPSESLR